MTFRYLIPALALGSVAVAQTRPGDPFAFDIRLPDTLPLRLQDPLTLGKPQLSFSGNFTKTTGPVRPAPSKAASRPAPVEMPIVKPSPDLAHTMPIVAPRPGVDYKIATVPEPEKAAVAATTPEQR